MRQELFAHTDSVIADGKSQHGVSVKTVPFLDKKTYCSTFWSEFDCISQDIDKNLSELRAVSYVIIAEASYDPAALNEK